MAQAVTRKGGVRLAITIGSSPAAAGATLISGTLQLQPADATHPGILTAGPAVQVIGGPKTFSGLLTTGNDVVMADRAGINFDGTDDFSSVIWHDNGTDVLNLQNGLGSLSIGTSGGNGVVVVSSNSGLIVGAPGISTTGAIAATSGFTSAAGQTGASQGMNFSGSNTNIVAGGGSAFQVGLTGNDGTVYLTATGNGINSLGNTAVKVLVGTGSPESAVTAIVGSLFLRTDGGATTTLYVKTSGSGNTGWTAK